MLETLPKTEECINEWVSNAEITTENGERWILDYYLQSHEMEESDDEAPGKAYGLRVDKSTPEGVLIEREETRGITQDRAAAQVMAETFAQGTVPPSVLLEMVDEWHIDDFATPPN